MSSVQITQIITDAAAANGIPVALALAQAQKESSLNPNAYNAKSGATGLFQLEPGTAADLGVTNPTDPAQNASGGMAYLAQLLARFGDWATALAAFDWGPKNVQDAIAAHGANWLAYAPGETRNYVSTLLPYATTSSSGTSPAGAGAIPASDSLDTLLSPDILAPSPSSGINVLAIAGLALAAWFGFGWLEHNLFA